MVLRKSEDGGSLVPAPLSKANPPYPTTPSEEFPPRLDSNNTTEPADPNRAPAFGIKSPKDPHDRVAKVDVDSDLSDDDEWDQSDDDFEAVDHKEVPDALKPAGGRIPANISNSSIPDSLRAGPPAGVPIPIKRSLDNISPMPTGASSSYSSDHSNGSLPLRTNNPYLKMQTTGPSNLGSESSQAIWGDVQGNAQTYERFNEPAELPAANTPVTSTNPNGFNSTNQNVPIRTQSIDQPPLIAVESATPTPTAKTDPHQDSVTANPWEPGADVSSFDTAPRGYDLPQHGSDQPHQISWQEQQDSEHGERERRQQEAHVAQEAATRAEQERQHEEGFHQFEQQQQQPPQYAPPPPPPVPQTQIEDSVPVPALPPRRSQEEQPPSMPPRPIETNVRTASIGAGPESPNTTMNRQRKEHYQIKHIRWHDYNKSGIRTSPILTQNLNGPCPLLALVNALILSTPAGIETALVETLRTRETVSLGLLLDAVFDELMSGRRGDAAQALPDVSDLYKFLLALHTGLNVNPMFVPDITAPDGTNSLTNRAGGFEDTKDMKLYRTFDIPLMHGWLPERDSEAYNAFTRVAKSYETSQYVQFQEEELDAKLQSGEPLTEDEQQMFTDIHAIKEFLSRWPTQLTDHGLRVMKDTLRDGQVAILFRNDHFSTLCKDPRTGGLVTLVTDQGYSSHDEIVWESLTDVNGQGSQHFSGDFRSVDNSTTHVAQQGQTNTQSLLDADDGQGWTTVQPRRGNQQQAAMDEPTSPSGLTRAEQEDHDLALALQLQEEEEDRQRRETEQRNQENNRLSANAIAAQSTHQPNHNRRASREGAPAIPPRRNNITTHRPTNEPAPPPTYEEASTTPRYNPPPGHPASTQAPFPPQGQPQAGSAYQASNPGRYRPRPGPGQPSMNTMPSRPGRRPSANMSTQGAHEEREKCIVM